MKLAPRAVLACVLLTQLWPGAARSQISTRVQSGDLDSNGIGIARFEDLGADRRYAVFRGRTNAIMAWDPVNGLRVVISTSTPLPPPLTGTFNRLFDASVNDAGDVVFRAGLNDATQAEGVFLLPAGGTPIDITAGVATPINLGLNADIDNARNIVWAADRNRDLYYYNATTGTNTQFVVRGAATVPGGGVWRSFGDRPVISDAGYIAFVANVDPPAPDGVFLYEIATGTIREIARTGAASPVTGYTYGSFDLDRAVAIGPGGQVAFMAPLAGGAPTKAVFTYNPATGSTNIVARLGDAVAGAPGALQDIRDDYVGVGPAGETAFVGDFPGPLGFDERLVLLSAGVLATDSPTLLFHSHFCPRRSAAGTVWTVNDDIVRSNGAGGVTSVLGRASVTAIGQDVRGFEPCLSFTSGIVVFAADHDTFHIHDGSVAEGFIQAGDPSPRGGGTTVTTLFEPAYGRRGVAFQVGDNGPLVPGLLSVPQAVGWRAVNSTSILPVVASTDPAPAAVGGVFDLRGPAGLAVHGRTVYFMSYIFGATATDGIFYRRIGTGQPPRVIVTDGAPAATGATFDSFDHDEVHTRRQRVLFKTHLSNGNDAIYLIRRNGALPATQIVQAGDPAPGTGGDTFQTFGRLGINNNLDVAFAASTTNAITGIWINRGGVITLVALAGAPAAPSIGGTLNFANFQSMPMGTGRPGVVLFGTSIVSPALADEVLHRFDPNPPTLSAVIAAPGTVAPMGGTFRSVDLGGRMVVERGRAYSILNLTMEGYEYGIMQFRY